jgi:methylmalonyl-CoA/ethylmalonyl-CoA epimerase
MSSHMGGISSENHTQPVTPVGLQRIDHIGLVVQDLDAALQTYCNSLGFRLLERISIPEQLVEAAFLDAGNGTVELIAPTDTTSGTARFLQTRGEGTHHLCFEVEDIVAALAELEAKGLKLIDATPRQGVHGLVAFVHPKATHGLMIELLQRAQAHAGHD